MKGPDGKSKPPNSPDRSDEFEAVDAGLVARRGELSVDGTAVARSQEIRLNTSYFSGPVPRPEILKQYNEICPGAADRIFAMSEREGELRRDEVQKENEHRRELEKLATRAAITTESRGQKFGFIALMTTTLMGGGLLALGVQAAGISMVIGSLVLMLGAAIWRRFDERKESRDEQIAALDRKKLEQKRLEDAKGKQEKQEQQKQEQQPRKQNAKNKKKSDGKPGS